MPDCSRFLDTPPADVLLMESDFEMLIYAQDRFSNRVSLRDSGKYVSERRFSSMSRDACTNKQPACDQSFDHSLSSNIKRRPDAIHRPEGETAETAYDTYKVYARGVPSPIDVLIGISLPLS